QTQFTPRFKNPGIGIGSVGPKPIRPDDPDPGSAEPGRARLSQGWVDRPIIQWTQPELSLGLARTQPMTRLNRIGPARADPRRIGPSSASRPSLAEPVRS
ncbi:hypothetical protein Taro_022357, partial [Colocasia esculenta]|nr:hypothetical protein [Colocasia esculenta]